MTSHLTTDLLERVSAFLNGAAAVVSDSYLFTLCARSLTEVASKMPEYFDGLARSGGFAQELANILRKVREHGPALDDLQGEVHALVECLAVIARENTELGRTADMPAQQELMRFFETCGMWEKESGLLACIAYYDLGDKSRR